MIAKMEHVLDNKDKFNLIVIMNKTISSSKAIITIVVLAILFVGGVFAYQAYYPTPEQKIEIITSETDNNEEGVIKEEKEIITPDNFPYLQCSNDEDCPSVDKPGWACQTYCDEKNICAFKCKQYSSSVSDNSFLFSSIKDINSYEYVDYSINTEDYLLDYERDFPPEYYKERFCDDNYCDYDDRKIHILKGESSNAESASCYISKSDCREKLNKLKNYFKELETLIEDAEPISCSAWKERKTGFASEVFKDHLVVKVSNNYRNPQESQDYYLEIDFVMRGEKKNSYFIDLRRGDHYCYRGEVKESLLNNFSKKIEDLIYSFY